MKIVQISIGRFHHFHLARELHWRGLLETIYTGYPAFKLKDTGIPAARIATFPWLQAPFMVRTRIPVRTNWIDSQWAWAAHETLDRFAARTLPRSDILIALSGAGLLTGRRMRASGGIYICDRGSAHIQFQHDLMAEEYARWGLPFRPDRRKADRELCEYDEADGITVPSRFAFDSFVKSGVSAKKLRLVPYGINLSRFRPTGTPDPARFTVLYVGQLSLRKGIPYLLQAFARLKHPGKRLKLIGLPDREIDPILRRLSQQNVEIVGRVPNADLARHYSEADVFAFPSIEDGFGMVMGEALACGCPVVASEHTGARDLIEDGKEGFIVPIRDEAALAARLQQLVDDHDLRFDMRRNALTRAKLIGGWTQYGDGMLEALKTFFPRAH